MDARMISFWGCECNPTANPETANNGGGYSQPSGGILIALADGEYITATVDNLSCGDFGTSILWTMESTDGRSWGGCCGTMDDAMVDNDWSESSLQSVSGVYGVDAHEILMDAIDAAAYAASAAIL